MTWKCEILVLLILLLPLSTGYELWKNMPLKKAGGKPNHGILQGWIPNNSPNDNIKSKRKVDLSPKGNMGRYWIRQFNHADDTDDLLEPNLSSWNSDPYGYDPMAPMTEFKK